MSSILLVEPDREALARIAGWLESEGHEVFVCVGPSAPDYTCVGARCGSCVLADAAATVVLDMRLASDDAMIGTPSWQLLELYVAMGKRVVAITDEGAPPTGDSGVVFVQRPARRESLLAAVGHGDAPIRKEAV